MAQASSAAPSADVRSISSPSQSASSPTETNSSLTKSGQDQILSEGEDNEQNICEQNITKPNQSVNKDITPEGREYSGGKPKQNLQSPGKFGQSRTAYSPETETVDDEDELSAAGGGGFNPTRDSLADGLVGLLRPSLEALDKGVCNTRDAQSELKERISALEQQLLAIEAEQSCPVDLETYINKLNSSKKRILVINTILQGAQVKDHFLDLYLKAIVKHGPPLQSICGISNICYFCFKDRLNKVHQSCLKETAKRRTLLEPSPVSATSHLHDTASVSYTHLTLPTNREV